MMEPKKVQCGLDVCNVPDITATVYHAGQSGFDFVTVPLVHPRLRREFVHGKAKDRQGQFTRADMVLSSTDWMNYIYAKISPHLNVDSEIQHIRKNSEQELLQELSYAQHLSLQAAIIQLHHDHHVNLARLIHQQVFKCSHFQKPLAIWVSVPMVAPKVTADRYIENGETAEKPLANGCLTDVMNGEVLTPGETVWDDDAEDDAMPKGDNTWHWWHSFHVLCNLEKRVYLALEMTAELPPLKTIKRWLGEPVKAVFVPTNIFLTNKKGFPVLARAHQNVLKMFFEQDVSVVITGASKHDDIRRYQQYMEFLYNSLPQPDYISQFARGFEDYLQTPLQPLSDNLESQTYETFERDPIKYSEYQKAIYLALLDRSTNSATVPVVMVVGAGRGPLIRVSLTAAKKAGLHIKLYAVEKNINAIATLCHHKDEMWGDQVEVVSCDMRDFNPPEKADIIVSELLGSFGDNELSPECLDGAQKFLKDDGISIPSSYTSYVCPIQSTRLYTDARFPKEQYKHPLVGLEELYVVRLQNRNELGAPQPLFTFKHPNRDPVIDNTRYSRLQFKIPIESILHGFAGFFDTVLYKNVTLSIVPSRHSQGMISWFPIYLPIKEPMALPKGSTLEAHFWRCADKHKVWYEWCISKPHPSTIHNALGRCSKIGL